MGHRLGSNVCEPHTCICGKNDRARGLYGLACHKSAGHQQHMVLSDIIWRAVRRADVRQSRSQLEYCVRKKRNPIIRVSSCGQCANAWHGMWLCLTLNADSLLTATSPAVVSIVSEAATHKMSKYITIASTYHYLPVAIVTYLVFYNEAEEFMQQVRYRCMEVNGDPKETSYRFQQISVAVKEAMPSHSMEPLQRSSSQTSFLYIQFLACALLLAVLKENNNAGQFISVSCIGYTSRLPSQCTVRGFYNNTVQYNTIQQNL